MTDPVWWFFLTWLPGYFNDSRGLNIKASWSLLASIYAIITVLSIGGGWVTGFLTGRGWTVTRARKTGMFIFALCVLPLLIITKVDNWTAVFLIGLAGAAHQAWSANLYTTVSDMFPKRAVAKLTGIGSTAGSLGGMAFPLLVGVILDAMPKTVGYAIIFGFCSVAYLLAFGVHHWLAPKFEPVDMGK
jgi:ACS family hexuronate transporter-like MFS transporter